jgi:hypothetical protein
MYVEVDVDLSDFDEEELANELEYRGYIVFKNDRPKDELIESIYLKRRLRQDYQAELDKLIYQTIGKIL